MAKTQEAPPQLPDPETPENAETPGDGTRANPGAETPKTQENPETTETPGGRDPGDTGCRNSADTETPSGGNPEGETPDDETPCGETPDPELSDAPGSLPEQIGRDALRAHPRFKAVFVTADGYVFPVEVDAINYAANLPNQKIVTVNRK